MYLSWHPGLNFYGPHGRHWCRNFIVLEQFSILLQCEVFPHLTLFVCSTFGPPLPHSDFQTAKTRRKLAWKKIVKLADHTCACNDLTKFEYYARKRKLCEYNEVCLQNSWNHIKWTYIWRVLATILNYYLVAPFYVKEKKHLEKIEISLVQSNSAVPYDVRSVILQFFSIRCNIASACA